MEFCLAASSHLDGVEAIYREILDYEEVHGSLTNWRRDVYPTRDTARRALEQGELYVALEEGQVAATAVLNRWQLPEYALIPWRFQAPEDQVMVIHTLCVPPSRSRRGLARGFVSFAEGLGRDMGCRVMRLDTYQGNAPAAALYPALGYRLAGSALFHFQNVIWETLLCFEKEL